ncbi:type II secretion system protein [Sedimentibacter sp.]|uniref:type IV pilus modification PilV family protein n=1 Tax=Sedimentibacter sp. TaxID=1960295 RepID=UPI002897794B|nr:type II secretion system protein [Sedimentibacter sp.]
MKNNEGFTLLEVILTLSIFGLVVTPLMSMLVFAAKINHESDREYKSFLAAQSCMEEIKAAGIDNEDYIYDSNTGSYERTISQNDNEFGYEVRIVPEKSFYYVIDISILDNGEVINTLRGSMIVK